jgi:hypothetical protein
MGYLSIALILFICKSVVETGVELLFQSPLTITFSKSSHNVIVVHLKGTWTFWSLLTMPSS